MATYTLRRVSRVTTGKPIREGSKVDSGDIFVTRWRLSDGRVVSQEVTAEEYATRKDKNPPPMPNRTGDPRAVYLGGWSEVRFNTPTGRMEPGDVWPDSTTLLMRLPGLRGGDVRVALSEFTGATTDVTRLRLAEGKVPGLSIRDGIATVVD